MHFVKRLLLCCTLSLLLSVAMNAQNTVPSSATAVVPQLVNFSGSAINDQGKPITGIVGLTFSIYNAREGGAPLWMETQNVTADARGNYTVQLGAAASQGLPLDVFTSGEARWLGVRLNGGEEQARVLLLSVPYALKAADAQTLSGLPASAFALAGSSGSVAQATPVSSSPANTGLPTVGGGGLENYIPIWADNNDDLANSILYQTGSGSGAKIGVNITKPLFTLDVNGQELVRGLFEMATQNYASKTKGYDSQPLNLESSAFNSTTGTYTLNHFQWQAEPTGNNTTTPGATLNLLYGTDPNQPAETGLNIASTGQITFATGQTFPGAGTITGVTTASGSGLNGGGTSGNLNLSLVNTCATNQVLQWNGTAWACSSAGTGTITGVTAGTDLTGGGTSGNVTLNLDTTQVPLLNAANTFTGVQTVNGSLSANEGLSGNSIGSGVYGAGGNSGVYGDSGNTGVYGVGGAYGVSGTSASGTGVSGTSTSTINGFGVLGQGPAVGVAGYGTSGTGVFGYGNTGVLGESANSTGSGGSFSNSTAGDALFTYNGSGGYAAFFEGNVDVDGKLSKAGGQFHIDHPLDPANKYLNHSFVESPDMKNIYDGVATLNANGEATVEMPDWFGVLNRDFRYQLTCIGGFAPVYIAEELANNRFKIGGGRAGMRISWQITGIRQDAWANANRIPVEEEKEAKLKGFYLHPQLYGAPAEKGIAWARHPELMKKLQQDEEQMKEKQAGPIESPMMARPPRPIPPLILGKPAPLIPPAPLPHRVTK
ncbi:MAG TPA: hypothetical protein VKR57_00640 [Terriglobales bacterium]|nr:hypothetical protein [Terriglobales bacterium]